ncbi:hypothetical protein ABH940_004368 [Streptacidiphilus sp. BW17]
MAAMAVEVGGDVAGADRVDLDAVRQQVSGVLQGEGMAQLPLSRAIAQLERRMGVQLLERTSRAVNLTAAGQVFLTESRKALDAVSASVRRAQRAGRTDPKLTLAMKPNGDAGLLESILQRYHRDPDAVDIDVTVCGIGSRLRFCSTAGPMSRS